MINVGLYPIGSAYRLRIPLPNIGECWFTVDYSQNIASFIEELKQEDPFIHEIHSDSPLKLFKDVVEEGMTLKINDTLYHFKTSAMNEVLESKSIASTFIQNLEQSNIKSKKELDEFVNKALRDLGEQFGTYLSALHNSVNDIDIQLQIINQNEEEITRKTQRRSNLFCGLGLSFLTAQWGFFYYTIYEVDWLGWDLMEPITYTVGQAGFIYSLYYYLATMQNHGYETMLSRFEFQKKQYLLRQKGVDTGRIKYLLEEKNRILSMIEVIEQRLV